MEESQETSDGRFRFDRCLGRGSGATVWLAVDTGNGRQAAVKVAPSPDRLAIARLATEAVALARINAPMIPACLAVAPQAQPPYVAMELVKGVTLKEFLRQRGNSLPLPLFFGIARGLARALQACERAGIAHCDLKPSNFMIDDVGRVWLIDFDVARCMDQSDTDSSRGDSIVGSLQYMAPEALNRAQASTSADIYSLGAVFYEMLTGLPLRALQAPVEMLVDIAQQRSQSRRNPRSGNCRLDRLVMQMLEHQSNQRPQTCQAILNALLDAQREMRTRACMFRTLLIIVLNVFEPVNIPLTAPIRSCSRNLTRSG